MAIDVIRRTPQKENHTMAQHFGEFGSNLLQAIGGRQERDIQKQKQQAFADQVKQMTGRDVSGLPPEAQMEFLKMSEQARNAQELEKTKNSFKTQQNQQKQDYLGNLFGGGQKDQLMDQQQQEGFNAANLSDEDIARATSIDPNLGRALGHQKDVALREQTEDRKLKFKTKESGHNRALKTLDKVDALGQEIPLLESSVNAMEDAIVNGDQSFWSLDNLAEMTGLELFRTAKGGQFKTAAKTYFINDLKTSGARPNQFIEKQLADALAKVGRSQEANQTVVESFKFSNDLKKKYHETARDLEKFYDEHNDGILPSSFSRKIEDQMKDYVEMRQESYEKKLAELAAQEKKKEKHGHKVEKLSGKFVDVKGPDGQIYEVDQSEVGLLPAGYLIQ